MLSSNEFGIFGSRLNTAFSPLTSINENVDDTRTSYYNVLSGTSMSCLHDSAAAAAYVKSFHPNWSPAIIFDDYRETEASAASAKISAHDTTPLQTSSSSFLMLSTTLNPLAELAFGAAPFSLSFPSNKIDPSHPCRPIVKMETDEAGSNAWIVHQGLLNYSADDCRNIGASGGVERRSQLPICLTEELEDEYGGGKHGGDVGKQGKVGRHVMLNHN
nr:subtilisin-like protease SBT4.15 [Ipomoea batatas]